MESGRGCLPSGRELVDVVMPGRRKMCGETLVMSSWLWRAEERSRRVVPTERARLRNGATGMQCAWMICIEAGRAAAIGSCSGCLG